MTEADSPKFCAKLEWALRLHKAGVFDEAADTYQEILRRSPLHPEAAFLLGSIELEQGDTAPACLHLAIAAGGLNSGEEAQAGFARAYEKLDETERETTLANFSALLTTERATERSAPVIRILRLLGETHAALSLIESTLQTAPNYGDLQRLRGQLLLDFGQEREALSAFEEALEFLPEDCELLTVHSATLARSGRAEEALGFAKRAAENAIGLDDADARRSALVQLLSCFIDLQRLPDACVALHAYCKDAPQLPETWLVLARCLHFSGHQKEAETIAGEGVSRFPNNLELEWLYCVYALAPIYRSADELEKSRELYAARLARLAERVAGADEHTRSRARLISQDLTPYLLPYQCGDDDRQLQETYGGMLVELSEHKSTAKPVTPRSDGLITIAFVSGFVWRHTNWRMKRGWLKYLNQDRFHVTCLHLGERCDDMTLEIEGYCNAFYHLPSNYDRAIRTLRDIRPEVIFYPEIGMSGPAQRLAAERLAPVQCCAIGHPVTTGLSTIDFFITGELIEPENAEANYTETLIKLPGISFPYLPVTLPSEALPRSHFDLPNDAALFLCLQTPQKYLPTDDKLYSQIATRVPKAVFVFLGGGSSIFDMSILRDRLTNTFRQAKLDPELHLRFLPHLNPVEYQALNALGDVYLDTPGWSGGNTTLEAIYQGLPIVTMRGRKMRACVSAGMLEFIGITHTIAADDDEFVDIAVRLALDKSWNESVRNRLRAGRSRLETDMSSIRAMENFFEKAVKDTIT